MFIVARKELIEIDGEVPRWKLLLPDGLSYDRLTLVSRESDNLPHKLSIYYIETSDTQAIIDDPNCWLIEDVNNLDIEAFMAWLNSLGLGKAELAENAPEYNISVPELQAAMMAILEA